MLDLREWPASPGSRDGVAVIDPRMLAPEDLGVGRRHDGLWIRSSIRLDGDLPARVRALVDDPRRTDAERAADGRALQLLVAHDPPARARHLVLGALLDFVARGRAGGDAVWDPRLDEVAELAGALRHGWDRHGIVVPPHAREQLADRVAVLRKALVTVDGVGAAYKQLGTWFGPRLTAERIALRVAAERCRVVAEHARGVVARTLDATAAARYRRLAEECEALAAAVRALDG
jgi:hypothetical protein